MGSREKHLKDPCPECCDVARSFIQDAKSKKFPSFSSPSVPPWKKTQPCLSRVRQRPMSRVSASFGACMPFLRLQVATRPTGSHSPRKKRPHRVSAVTVPDERELCSPGVLTRSLFKIASQLLRSSWASDRVHPLMNDPFPM